jgi:hypothetical protein
LLALAAFAMSALGWTPAAHAAGSEEPLPEPLINETTTDIDGTEAGEAEFEGNGIWLRARRGGATSLDTSLEVEWLILRRLGLRLEPSLERDKDGRSATSFGVGGGLSWKLLQDFERQVFVDVEARGRWPFTRETYLRIDEPELPFALATNAGMRLGFLTLRGSLGIEFGNTTPAAAPRAGLAALAPLDASGRFGFFGLEVNMDAARGAPLIVAPNLVPNFVPAGFPLRVGLALPWVVGAEGTRPSFGLYVRLFYESSREILFAKKGHAP